MHRKHTILATLALTLAFGTCLAVQAEAKKTAPAKAVKKAQAKAKPKRKRRPPNPALKPIQDTPGLPRVLLIGDSISIGYTIPTRKLLDGKANVHRPRANCGPTSRGVEHIDDWLGSGKWDVIHFNWGLHDLKYMDDGKRQVPPDAYEKNLATLVARMKETAAKLIWCSTTPVPEGKLRPPRKNADVILYNTIARKIAEKNGIAIDDLYAFAVPRLKQIQRPANVHFTPEGSRVLAHKVAASILDALGKPDEARKLLGRVAETGAEVKAPAPDLLAVVRAYADAMIAKGRDRYGTVHSPLFAVTLNRKTMALPEDDTLKALQNLKRESWGIRPHDRMLTGANPMHDENLYQVLYALAKLTGKERYGAEADKALTFFFENCQSDATGLMAWGEHIGWDFNTDKIIDKPAGMTHEYFRPWVLMTRCFDLAPKAARRFAAGVWAHQIGDPKTGNFSRHARYDKHGPGKNSEYPRHGGFYIHTWATAYERTKDPVFLKAIETLVDYFDGRRSPKTDAIPAESSKRSQGKMMWPPSNVSLAIDLWDGAAKVPDPLASKMRKSAARTDQVFLKLPHDVSPKGKGFVKIANTHSADARQWSGRNAYARMWATGYGDQTEAAMADLCMLRYRQNRDEGYKKLIVGAARRYLSSEPNIDFPVYPGTLGDVILLMLSAREITGENVFLERAEDFARRAVSMFVDDVSPLPKASSKHDHYEAITRADTLMMSLLKLWATKRKPDAKLELVYTDR